MSVVCAASSYGTIHVCIVDCRTDILPSIPPVTTPHHVWSISILAFAVTGQNKNKRCADKSESGRKVPVVRSAIRNFVLLSVISMFVLTFLSTFGAGAPLFPLVHLLPHLFPFLLFPFFHWLYLFSSFVHPFPFYQNSPTPFSGRRS